MESGGGKGFAWTKAEAELFKSVLSRDQKGMVSAVSSGATGLVPCPERTVWAYDYERPTAWMAALRMGNDVPEWLASAGVAWSDSGTGRSKRGGSMWEDVHPSSWVWVPGQIGLLAKLGATFGFVDENGGVLHRVARIGASEDFSAALERGGRETLSAVDFEGRGAVAIACRYDRLGLARRLLAAGASPLPGDPLVFCGMTLADVSESRRRRARKWCRMLASFGACPAEALPELSERVSRAVGAAAGTEVARIVEETNALSERTKIENASISGGNRPRRRVL